MSGWLNPWKWAAVFAVVGAVLWFHRHQIHEADQSGYARRVAEEQTAQLAAERRAKEEDARAIQSRTKELATVGDIYAARTPAVIGVCVTAPSLPRTAEAEPSSESRAARTGVLSEGNAPPAVSYFDVTPLDKLAIEADRIVAGCRAVQDRVAL